MRKNVVGGCRGSRERRLGWRLDWRLIWSRRTVRTQQAHLLEPELLAVQDDKAAVGVDLVACGRGRAEILVQSICKAQLAKKARQHCCWIVDHPVVRIVDYPCC